MSLVIFDSVVRTYSTCISALIIKMIFVPTLASYWRFKTKIINFFNALVQLISLNAFYFLTGLDTYRTYYQSFKENWKMPALISFDNPVFRDYAMFCALLAIKMMFMSALTGLRRLYIKSFVNPEDARFFDVPLSSDEKIERSKRAHINDMENIPLFFIMGFLYVLTDPSQLAAKVLFLIYTVTRYIHTIVYAIWVLPQPSRLISWGLGYGITAYMAVDIVVYVINY